MTYRHVSSERAKSTSIHKYNSCSSGKTPTTSQNQHAHDVQVHNDPHRGSNRSTQGIFGALSDG